MDGEDEPGLRVLVELGSYVPRGSWDRQEQVDVTLCTWAFPTPLPV